jgi:hypothetical protein
MSALVQALVLALVPDFDTTGLVLQLVRSNRQSNDFVKT